MPKFEVGHKKLGGKKVGTLNSRSKEFMAVLEQRNFCPASAMMDIFKISMERFVQETQKEDSGQISPMESNAAKYLKIAAEEANNLASYAYPKMKAIERTPLSPLDGMTPEQKLEAAKTAVKMLELKIKSD